MGIKHFIKRVCYKIYIIGKAENHKILEKEKLDFWKKNAVFDPDTVDIDFDATITNNKKDVNLVLIGKHTWIRGELIIFKHGGKICIGQDCLIGSNSKIWSSIGIYIGDRVLISHNVNIHDNISHPLDAEERHQDFSYIKKNKELREHTDIRESEITIENDVWIGFNSTVLKGVRIGQGSIIGANSVVTKDVPPFSIAVGNPAKIIRNVKTN